MVITIRTINPLRYEQVTTLQKDIVDGLKQPVTLKVNQIFAEQLNPLIPPTPSRTPTMTVTSTPGPSPTATPTTTFTPTNTPTNTPTHALIEVLKPKVTDMLLYQSPGGPEIGVIKQGQGLTLLYGKKDYEGLVWVEVMDAEGRIGWLPEIYLKVVTATPEDTEDGQ